MGDENQMKTRSLLILLVLLGVAFTSRAVAQQSLFQSSNTDTAIFLPGGAGVASYNLGSDTARFDFERDTGGNYAFGGGIGGTVKAGTGSLINSSSPANGGFAEGGGIIRFPPKLPRQCTVVKDDDPDLTVVGARKLPAACDRTFFRYLVLQFHYGRSEFYNLPSSSALLVTPAKIDFDNLRGTAAFNFLLNRKTATFHLGAAYVPQSANNQSDLKQQTYQTETIITSSGTQTTLSQQPKSVYVGDYKTHLGHMLNGDFVVQPKAFAYQLGFDVMFRSDLGGGPGVRFYSPGLGAYFFKKGSPVVPVAGIAYAYKMGKSDVSIVAGWTFGGTAASK